METNREQIENLIEKINLIIDSAAYLRSKYSHEINSALEPFQKSAGNLLDYLAFRKFDIRAIQDQLASLGLSSLGRSEGHIMASLLSVRSHLKLMIGREDQKSDMKGYVSYHESTQLLRENTLAVFGPNPSERNVHIMVSLSKEAATDYRHVSDLIASGMNCARINCAHDDENVWLAMIQNIKKASSELNLSCKILMDLGGPKLRTGLVKKGPKIVTVKPVFDHFGNIISSAIIFFSYHAPKKADGAEVVIPININSTEYIKEGAQYFFKDNRNKKRSFKILAVNESGFYAEFSSTSIFQTGLKLTLHVEGQKINAVVGELPSVDQFLLLKKDDFLILHASKEEGEEAKYNEKGDVVRPAHISCTLPEVFKDVKKGERILLNDGKIEGIIVTVNEIEMTIQITNAKGSGSKLRSDKGINFPDSELSIEGLTDKDKEDLKFIVTHADILNMSFVSKPHDIFNLKDHLRTLGAKDMAMMFKIETKLGFKNLPFLLLAAMQHHPVGIMIARGDLAAEAGWIRLAEMQEEILWLCEAAHIPSVWATQVLESLAQKGIPSRAEITDAAMSQRAECVMLNKGPYIVEAVKILHDILKSMKEHQYKKSSLLRSLGVSTLLDEEGERIIF